MYQRPDSQKKDTPKPITKHPCQNFIKYLIVANQNVQDVLRSFDLPDMPLGYFDYIRTTVPPNPPEFDPHNRYHKPSVKHLKDIGIYNLFHPDKYTTEAKGFLTDYELRPLVQDFLLARMKPIEVAKKANSKLSTLITEEAVDRYRHYFWNVNLLRIEDWAKVFAVPSERHKITSIVRNGAGYAAHKHGFVEKIEAKEALREALGIIYFDMQDWRHKPVSSEKTKSLSIIAHDIAMIDDRLSSMDITMKETLKQFQDFKMEHRNPKITGMSDTAAIGNYSNSGRELKEADLASLKLLEAKSSGDYVVAELDES